MVNKIKTDGKAEKVAALAAGGRVARMLPGYEVRPQQLQMAEAVTKAFADRKHLIVEAGTGVGKSFAYLVPAIEHVLEHGGRVVISTHTIALQEQLVHKDIPFLRRVYPNGFSAVLMKGRSNYLGLRRMKRAIEKKNSLFDSSGQLEQLRRIEKWSGRTRDGSLSDLAKEPSPQVWELAKSDADDCFGRKCPHFTQCFYQRARRRANSAHLLIVNHALLFSDLGMRAQGSSFLPPYDYVILDEAHTIDRVAGDHLGLSMSNLQIRFLLNGLWNERTQRGALAGRRETGELLQKVREAREASERYFRDLLAWSSGRADFNGRLRETAPIEQPVSTTLKMLQDALREAREKLSDEQDKSEFAALMERCKSLAAAVDHWHRQQSEGWVYWIAASGGGRGRDGLFMDGAHEFRGRITFCARPVEIGTELKAMLFDKVRSAVLTSATLTTPTGDPFGYIRGRVGLEQCRELSLGSPFDYRKQLRVYVEAGMPDPSNGSSYLPAACEAIKRYVLQTAGRAFVLFTSYSMMDEAARRLEGFFTEEKMTLFLQGSGLPRSKMLEKFRSTPRSVLFGTDTFWTGVDVPGEALSNVMIVKLPFAVPNEPMVEARIERIRESGGNPFMDFQVPEAVLKLRQGVGRLIRTRKDTGIVVLLDPRVRTKPYGRMFLQALPACEVMVQR